MSRYYVLRQNVARLGQNGTMASTTGWLCRTCSSITRVIVVAGHGTQVGGTVSGNSIHNVLGYLKDAGWLVPDTNYRERMILHFMVCEGWNKTTLSDICAWLATWYMDNVIGVVGAGSVGVTASGVTGGELGDYCVKFRRTIESIFPRTQLEL